MDKVGFIGLGWMGNPMAQNLAKAGFDLSVFDMKAEATVAARGPGAKVAGSVGELAARDIVFVMVNTPQQVRDVVGGEKGLAPHLPAGHKLLVVLMATVSPMLVRELASQLAGKGIEVVDAPVSGGPVLAEAGKMSIMFGGDEAVLRRVRPYLDAMARVVFHAGDAGAGMAVKLLNNMVAFAQASVFLEMLDIGCQWGMKPDNIRDVLQAGSGRNWGTDNWAVFKQFTHFAVIDDPNMVKTAMKDVAVAREWTSQAGIEVSVLPYVASIAEHGFKVSPTLKAVLWPEG